MGRLKKKKKIKRIREYPSYRDSPFSENLFLEDTEIRKKGIGKNQDVLLRGTLKKVLEDECIPVMYEIQKVGKEEFDKIYAESIRELFGLSVSETKLFLYISSILRLNKELVQIKKSECMAFTKIKTNETLYRGLSKLIEVKIICRAAIHQTYFINPAVFDPGDRMTFTEIIERECPIEYKEPLDEPNLDI